MSNFAPALRQHLEALPSLGLAEHRALRVLNAPDSPRRTRLLERWETASREEVGFNPNAIIDWFKANWTTILQVVLSILGLLLMFAEPAPISAEQLDRAEDQVSSGEIKTHNEARAMAGLDAEWFPGKNLLISIAPQLIDQIGLPWAREMAARLPVPVNYNDSDLKTFLLDTLAKSQT